MYLKNWKDGYNMKLPYLLNIKNPIEDFLQALICTYKETGISEIKKLSFSYLQ